MNRLPKILLLFAGLLIAAGGVFLPRLFAPEPVEATPTILPKKFGPAHYNRMNPDSLVMLATQAYHPFLRTSREGKTLTLSLTQANALTRDFFNGNDALLKFDRGDFGFQIIYRPDPPAIEALFDVQPDGSVIVPNDVILPMLARFQHVKKSESSKK